MSVRYRPIVRSGGPRPAGAVALAGGALWFAEVAEHRRGAAPRLSAAATLPPAVAGRLAAPRAPVCGPRPRSAADHGRAERHARTASRTAARTSGAMRRSRMRAPSPPKAPTSSTSAASSTRPGADPVPVEEEAARVVPVIAALRAEGFALPISIDTRNAVVARAAFDAGADLLNDVSALRHDPASLALAAASGRPVCLMHAQGDPRTMQEAPAYDDVLLDVFDFLEARVAAAEAAGIARTRILVDPGIGFGKTVAHNLALIRGLALFHGLGCGILFGASRKRFIGAIGRGGGAGRPGRPARSRLRWRLCARARR